MLKDEAEALATVHRQVSIPGSKYDRMGADVNDFLTLVKLFRMPRSRYTRFLVLRSGRNGASRVAMVDVLAVS